MHVFTHKEHTMRHVGQGRRWTFAVILIVAALGGCGTDLGPANDQPEPSFLKSAEFYGCDLVSDPTCKPRMPTAAELKAIVGAIDAMTCSNIQATLMEYVERSDIKVYDTDDGNWGDNHSSLNEIHIWAGSFNTPGMVGETLAHEGAHITFDTNSELLASMMEVQCGTR